MRRILLMLTIIALITLPVVADTETFSLSYSPGVVSQSVSVNAATLNSINDNKTLAIDFDAVGIPTDWIMYQSTDTQVRGETAFTLEYPHTGNGATIATGTIRVQNGTFTGGLYHQYVWLEFDTWNPGTLTGGKLVKINYNSALLPGQWKDQNNVANIGLPSAKIYLYDEFRTRSYNGLYITVTDPGTSNSFTLTNLTPTSSTMWSKFSIDKNALATTVRVTSNNVTVYTGPTDLLDISDTPGILLNGNNLVFSMYVPSASVFVNSSVKFPSTTTSTYTTVNTYFQCVDGQDSSSIYGCNLALKDETVGYWSNSTADSDGTHYIATNSSDLVSGYATATGFQSTSRTNLATFAGGIYELIMWPDDSVCTTPGECGTTYDPGSGNINLLIMVNDKDTGDPIADANIKLVEDVGATTYGTTNDAGVEMFFFSNKTQVRIVASKTGYTSASKIHTTSDFGPDTVRLELSKSYVTVTPTVTITDGSGNPVETIDTRTASEQDQALFDKLRKEAPGLIDLCILGITAYILMSILGLFGVKF